MNHALRFLSALMLAPLAMALCPERVAAAAPPATDPICIDVGRQLFVDDFLIAETELERTYHPAALHVSNPVLQPATPLEMNVIRGRDALPVAAPFGDGAWFDATDGLFKMWYHAGWFDGIGYATSKDGIRWERPSLDGATGTNRVLPPREEGGCTMMRDAVSVWHDASSEDAAARWKMFVFSRLDGRPEGESHGELFASPDGVRWTTLRPVGFWHGDNTSIFHDPFRGQWVLSVRERAPSLHDPVRSVRARFIHTAADFSKLGERPGRQRAPLWMKLDARDRPDLDLGYEPELYHFTATPYESLMVGVFGIFYGPPNEVCAKARRPKIIDLQLGYSRDGFVYDRPHRAAFLKCARAPGAWNRGYLHPATGVCLIVGDRLYFYFGAWSGTGAGREHMYAGGNTGLATLRRDGFASMDAVETPGTVTTVPIVFHGRHPFVNVATENGELRAEVLDAEGRVIPPFSRDRAIPVRVDSTRQRLAWEGADDLSAVAGKPARLRFHVSNGSLYAFWVTPDPNGASYGYVAAGGPGLGWPTDRPKGQ